MNSLRSMGTTYQIVKPKNILGMGASSEVLEGLDVKTKISVAIKSMDVVEDSQLKEVSKEVQINAFIRHPNLVPLLHAYTCDEEKLYLVMPKYKCSATSLIKEKHPDGIKDPVILATILKKCLLALEYLHKSNVLHRDIKGGNILFSDKGEVALSDFGVSKLISNPFNRGGNRARTFVGTPCWMAPEVMEQVKGYDCPADVWSLGITALELAYGYAPYSKMPPMKILLMTLQKEPPSTKTYEAKCSIAKSFGKFVNACLKKNPNNRSKIKDLLKHKFITKYAPKDEECNATILKLF